MKRNQGFSTIMLVIIFVALVSVFGIIYIVNRNTKAVTERNKDLAQTKQTQVVLEKSLTKLEEAKIKLETEKQILEAMKIRASDEKGLSGKLEKERSNAINFVTNKTDIFFSNPKGTNPTVKIKSSNSAKIIANQKQINASLNLWQNKINEYKKVTAPNATTQTKLSIVDITNIANQTISLIQQNITELQNALNEAIDSGTLTNSQIANYESAIDSANNAIQNINEIVSVLTNTAEDIIASAPVSNTIIPANNNSGNNNTNNNSSGTTENVPVVNQAVVTPVDIAEQEDAVEEAEEEVIEAEEEEQAAEESTIIPTDTIAPNTSITNPTNNSSVSYVVPIMASATDNTGVVKVEFYSGDTLLGQDTISPYSISWDTMGETNGVKTLKVKAYDLAGNVKTSNSIIVTVSNTIVDSNDPVGTNTWAPDIIEGANPIN